MSLFKKRKASSLLSGSSVESPIVEQSMVLDYIVDLDDPEFDKLIKVAAVYRKANKEAIKIWGVEALPQYTDPSDEESGMDDLDSAFLTDDEVRNGANHDRQ